MVWFMLHSSGNCIIAICKRCCALIEKSSFDKTNIEKPSLGSSAIFTFYVHFSWKCNTYWTNKRYFDIFGFVTRWSTSYCIHFYWLVANNYSVFAVQQLTWDNYCRTDFKWEIIFTIEVLQSSCTVCCSWVELWGSYDATLFFGWVDVEQISWSERLIVEDLVAKCCSKYNCRSCMQFSYQRYLWLVSYMKILY